MNKLNLKISLSIALIAMIIIGVVSCSKDDERTVVLPFTVKSSELTTSMANAQYANGFGGCTGDNKSPQLSWENAPSNTKSFAVIVYDKDANSGAGFNHWLLVDIPASTTNLLQDAGNFSGVNIPTGSIQTQTDAHVAGYVGVCPPVGETHNYEITVFALNVATVGLTSTATPTEVKTALASKTLASSTMTVTATH